MCIPSLSISWWWVGWVGVELEKEEVFLKMKRKRSHLLIHREFVWFLIGTSAVPSSFGSETCESLRQGGYATRKHTPMDYRSSNGCDGATGKLGGHEGDIHGLTRTFCRCRPLVLYVIRPLPASGEIRTAHRITMGMPFARAAYIFQQIFIHHNVARTLRPPVTIKCYPPIPLQLHDPVQKMTESWVLSATINNSTLILTFPPFPITTHPPRPIPWK